MNEFAEILERLHRLEELLSVLVQQQTVRDWYTTEQVAQVLGKTDYTVREWCRHGRVHAEKKGSGRGKHCAWVISHAELLRIQRDGLRPIQTPYQSRAV